MTTPTTTVTVPAGMILRDLFENLLGRDVTVSPAKGPATENGKGLIATYVDDHGAVRAAIGWDLPASAAIGGALGLLPPGLITDMVKEGQLRADVVENLLEAANIASTAFHHHPANPALRLGPHYLPAATAPEPVRTLATRHANRLDLTLQVKGYGPGQISIVGAG